MGQNFAGAWSSPATPPVAENPFDVRWINPHLGRYDVSCSQWRRVYSSGSDPKELAAYDREESVRRATWEVGEIPCLIHDCRLLSEYRSPYGGFGQAVFLSPRFRDGFTFHGESTRRNHINPPELIVYVVGDTEASDGDNDETGRT